MGRGEEEETSLEAGEWKERKRNLSKQGNGRREVEVESFEAGEWKRNLSKQGNGRREKEVESLEESGGMEGGERGRGVSLSKTDDPFKRAHKGKLGSGELGSLFRVSEIGLRWNTWSTP
jgi:hypothetical protein